MSTVWHGADPTPVADAADYELGTVVIALRDLTLTGIRVFSPDNAVDRPGRRGHVWTMDGTVIASITMPDHLPAGWSTHTLSAALNVPAGQARMVSYETGGNYADIPHGLDVPVVSVDGAAAYPASAVVGGNGRFNTTPGQFPDSTFNATWYAVDAVYTAATTSGGGGSPDGGTNLLEGIAQLLNDLGVGTYHADGTTGGTIFLAKYPDQPDQAIAVATYGGPESDSKLPDDMVSVQVRCRGTAADARTGYNTAKAVYDALHGLEHRALTSGDRLGLAVCTQSGPVYIGVDQLNRGEWTVNARLRIEHPTANRPA